MADGMENWGAPEPAPARLPTTKEEALQSFIADGGDPSQTVMLINMKFGSIYPGIPKQLIKTGASDGWFRTKAEFTSTVLAEEARRATIVAEEVGVSAAEADVVVSSPAISVNSRSSAAGGAGVTGGGSGATGGGAGANNGIRVTNPPEPEISLAIIPYVPTPTPADERVRARALESPVEFTKVPSNSNILMAIVIESLKIPLEIAKGSWYAISTIISQFSEKQLPKNTLLGLIRSGDITSYDQLKYRHDLLVKISEQIKTDKPLADAALINSARNAFSAGQEALIAAYTMFKSLQIVRDMYREVNPEDIAPGLTMVKASLDSAECILLKTYIIFVNAMIKKYKARREFTNNWLTTDERLRRKILNDNASKSFIANLFKRFSVFGQSNSSENTMNLASQYEYHGPENIGHTGQIGNIEALITANEMRMINALIVSILRKEVVCTPDNLKSEMTAILEMKEADVPGIINVARFESLHAKIIKEYTQGATTGGVVSAAFTRPILSNAAQEQVTREIRGGITGAPRTNFGRLLNTRQTEYTDERIETLKRDITNALVATINFTKSTMNTVAPYLRSVLRTVAIAPFYIFYAFGIPLRIRLGGRNSGGGVGAGEPPRLAGVRRPREEKAEPDEYPRIVRPRIEEGVVPGVNRGDEEMPGAAPAPQGGGYRKTRRAKHKKTRKARLNRNRKTRVQRKRLTRRR